MSRTSKRIIPFAAIFCLLLFAQSIYADTNHVIVDAPSLHIRTGPGLTYDVVGSLKQGDRVEILTTSNDWYEIKFGNGTGWIASWLTVPEDQPITEHTIIVSQVDALNIRSGPSVESAVLGRLQAGDEGVRIGQDGAWAKIAANGLEGWVHTDYISESRMQSEVTKPETEVEQGNDTETVQTKPPVRPKALKPDTYLVSVNALHVRKKADQSSKQIGMIHRGESYAITEIQGNWVRIALDKKKEGWVYSFHGTLLASETESSSEEHPEKNSTGQVTILTNGTNIREAATTSSEIVKRADAGEKFQILEEENNWYRIALPTGETAYVADWVVSTDEERSIAVHTEKKKAKRVPGTMKGLTIVIDPGHGGNDRGTTGARGTDEKGLTMLTAELLAAKLKAAGADVIMTREADTYVSLRKRVAISHQHEADAFISVHYDANPDASIQGFTTYFTQAAHKELAMAVNEGLASTVPLRDRGAQPGDFLVLRENRQNAILIELGFLSNPNEERIVTSNLFREQATHGIYKGLLDYFEGK
ncbi:SH3 domain-containing protein [Sporosarcina sp. 179-K 3D1 HS]|uniref:SH3 domain-containing protein n=1 Tax=Sporosarcina sp. 179-K 3D1 HS TaxID=3232169 RepID=UPI0039A26143